MQAAMLVEQWQTIERIFQSARALKGVERMAYINEACRGDETLQREVESLLAAYEKTGSFLNIPAHDVAARLLASDQPSLLARRPGDRSSLEPTKTPGLSPGLGGRPALYKRRWLVLGWLFFALMLCYTGVKSYLNLAFVRDLRCEPKWFAQQKDGGAIIIGFEEHSNPVISSLRIGDEIIAINRNQFTNIGQISEQEIYHLKPGTPYTLTIRRDEQLHEFTLTAPPAALSVKLWLLLWAVSIPLLRILTGFILFILRPSDMRGVLLAFFLAANPADVFANDFSGWMFGLILIGNLISGGFVPNAGPVLLHFSLIFPEPSPLVVRFPRLKYLIYLAMLLTVPLNALHTLNLAAGAEEADKFISYHLRLWSFSWSVFALYLASSILSQVLNYRRVSQAGRRKVQVALAGAVIAMLPITLWIALNMTVGWPVVSRTLSHLHPSLFGWVRLAVFGLTALFPLSFAYAILRHRVIPVSVIIRRTVQYLFAKNALRFILVLPVVAFLLNIFADRHRTLAEILFKNSIYFYVLSITALGLSLKFRRPLSEWIDRKFFREHYKQDKILRELIDDVKKTERVSEVSRLVGGKVDTALHPESLYCFYRDAERLELSLAYSSHGSDQRLCIPEEFQLLRHLESSDRAQDFPFPTRVDLPQGEKGWLSELGVELLVPMTGTDHRLAGLFLLGSKKSEVPYTAGDRELLNALAGQIAIVYENARLRDRVERDRKVQREVLARIERQEINLLMECPRCGACYDSFAKICERDHAELNLTLPVERTIDGRYRLDRMIGRGGMGAVFEATDLRLGRQVAVKILGGQFFGDSKALRRFEREAQAAARLNHPHIIAVYDYGLLKTAGAYLVMELVVGETLGTLLRHAGKLEARRAAQLFDQVLKGVGAAHEAGVVHRDLKPDNILLHDTSEGPSQVKILDFGLAKLAYPEGLALNGISDTVTTPGLVMGTFGYMSPEQLLGETADERSDLFAVGVMVVEALTGRLPFAARTFEEALASILQGTFHLSHDSESAMRLDEVLQRCLAKDRGLRYASAGEMRNELISTLREYDAWAPS